MRGLCFESGGGAALAFVQGLTGPVAARTVGRIIANRLCPPHDLTCARDAAPCPVTTRPRQQLDTFPNPAPQRDYLVHIEVPEFTCLCPMTGQPDFATMLLDYVPDKRNVELKSLKLYMWSYRDQGVFHEAVTNRILDDLVKALAPRFLRLTARWYVRGGIFTTVVAEHRKKGWKPAPHVELGRFAPESPMRGPGGLAG